MTGCGGRSIYCSRKSMDVRPGRVLVQKTARGLSRKGTRRFNPLFATLSNRPKRSTSITVAWGTILIVLIPITNSTIAMKPKKRNARAEVTGSIVDSCQSASKLRANYIGSERVATNHIRRLGALDADPVVLRMVWSNIAQPQNRKR